MRPTVLDGPMTGETFLRNVEQVLAPALSLGDIVIVDNLAAHKVAGIRQGHSAGFRARRPLGSAPDFERGNVIVKVAPLCPTGLSQRTWPA